MQGIIDPTLREINKPLYTQSKRSKKKPQKIHVKRFTGYKEEKIDNWELINIIKDIIAHTLFHFQKDL